MVVIDQELERENSHKTYLNIADELKWRLVESVSEGENFKIKSKMKEIKDRYLAECENIEEITVIEKEELNAIFDFVLTAK